LTVAPGRQQFGVAVEHAVEGDQPQDRGGEREPLGEPGRGDRFTGHPPQTVLLEGQADGERVSGQVGSVASGSSP
jgi:hypothetical protein